MITITNEIETALQVLNDISKKVVFLTGNAGTGKSTLIKYFISTTKLKCVLLAPTGVAANNIGGATIHSFFKFRPSPNLAEPSELKNMQKIDAKTFAAFDCLIIDEISMVRSDLMFAINHVLEKVNGLPFGGKKIIVVGDMMQLPPVVKDDEKSKLIQMIGGIYWFFGLPSNVNFTKIELKEVFRQKDNRFVCLLNELRNTKPNLNVLLPNLNERVGQIDNKALILCSTNSTADSLNMIRLSENKNKSFIFKGEIEGDFNVEKDCIAPFQIILKKGLRVMFCANNDMFKNGELGIIQNVDNETIEVLKDNGELVSVMPYTWKKRKYTTEIGIVGSKIEPKLLIRDTGSFTQIPLKVAYAITIHKSQGCTFDRVHLSNDKPMFAHGQLYVALSRCTSLNGITLTNEITKQDIIFDKTALI